MNPFARDPDDDADNLELLTATCEKCGAEFLAEADERVCHYCWRKQRERNEELVTAYVRNFFLRAEAS